MNRRAVLARFGSIVGVVMISYGCESNLKLSLRHRKIGKQIRAARILAIT